MLAAGLLDEVRGAPRRGYAPGTCGPCSAIGYRQAVAVVSRDGVSDAEAERDIVTETMRYAKRQMTWFRHQAATCAGCPDADAAYAAALAWLGGEE